MEALYLYMRGSIAPAHREFSIQHLKLLSGTFEPVNLPPQSMPAAGASAFFSAMLEIFVSVVGCVGCVGCVSKVDDVEELKSSR